MLGATSRQSALSTLPLHSPLVPPLRHRKKRRKPLRVFSRRPHLRLCRVRVSSPVLLQRGAALSRICVCVIAAPAPCVVYPPRLTLTCTSVCIMYMRDEGRQPRLEVSMCACEDSSGVNECAAVGITVGKNSGSPYVHTPSVFHVWIYIVHPCTIAAP